MEGTQKHETRHNTHKHEDENPMNEVIEVINFQFLETQKSRLLGLKTYSFSPQFYFEPLKPSEMNRSRRATRKNAQKFCLTPLGREVIST